MIESLRDALFTAPSSDTMKGLVDLTWCIMGNSQQTYQLWHCYIPLEIRNSIIIFGGEGFHRFTDFALIPIYLLTPFMTSFSLRTLT